MDRQKYEDTVTAKANILVPALTGTAMTLILIGKVFDSYGYTLFTVGPSVILILCLWIPFLQNRAYVKASQAD